MQKSFCVIKFSSKEVLQFTMKITYKNQTTQQFYSSMYIPKTENRYSNKNLYTSIYSSTVHKMTKRWEQPRCLSMCEWVLKNDNSYNGAFFNTKKECRTDTYDNLEEFENVLREASHERSHTVQPHLHEISSRGKSIKTESRLVIPRD